MSSPSMANVPATHQKDSISAAENEIPTVHAMMSFLKSPGFFKGAQITLRLVVVVASFTAMLCMLTSHQSTIILGMQFDARYSYSPALKFSVVANAIACLFMLMPLFPAIVFKRRGTCPSSCFYLLLNDMMMLTLVVAGCGSAAAIGDVGLHGNPHAGWDPICVHFSKFCGRATYSLTFSCVSAVALFILTTISALSFKDGHV